MPPIDCGVLHAMTLKPLEKDGPFFRRARLWRREIVIAVALTAVALLLLSAALFQSPGPPSAESGARDAARIALVRR